MKTLIKLDPDPAVWGWSSDGDEAMAERANAELLRLLSADGYGVEINSLAETKVIAETEAEREQALRDIERHFYAALCAARSMPHRPKP